MSWLFKLGFGPAIDKIDASEAHLAQCAGELFIIDVRDPDEWAKTGVPQGGHRLSVSDKNFTETVKSLLKGHETVPVALSCESGFRSSKAGKALHKVGVTNLKIVDGGLQLWLAAGLPVEK